MKNFSCLFHEIVPFAWAKCGAAVGPREKNRLSHTKVSPLFFLLSLGYFSAALPRQRGRKSRKWGKSCWGGRQNSKKRGEKELSGAQNKTKAKTYFFVSHFPGKRAEGFFILLSWRRIKKVLLRASFFQFSLRGLEASILWPNRVWKVWEIECCASRKKLVATHLIFPL